jgi:hypothetical protein
LGVAGDGGDGFDGFDGDGVEPLGAAHTSAQLPNMFTAAPIPSATASPASRPERAAMPIDSPPVPTML